jgi:predicted nucleotidyltransferase
VRKIDVIAILQSHADELRAAGVAHVSLFGSIARDEAGPESDVDLVIAGPPERPMTLFGLARAEAVLEPMLGRKVDLTAQQGLDRAVDFRRRITGDLVPAF